MRTYSYISYWAYLFFIMVLFLPLYTFAQSSDKFRETSYIQNFYLDDKGIIQKYYQFSEDSNGNIIVVSSDGVKYYNGFEWKTLKTEIQTGLTSVCFSKDNNLYVAGPIEVGYFNINKNGSANYESLADIISVEQEKVANIYSINDTSTLFVKETSVCSYSQTNRLQFSSTSKIISSIKFKDFVLAYREDGFLWKYTCNNNYSLIDLKEYGFIPNSTKLLNIDDSRILFLNSDLSYYVVDCQNIINGEKINPNKDIQKGVLPLSGDIFQINDLIYNSNLKKIAIATNYGVYIFSDKLEYVQVLKSRLNLPATSIQNLYFDSRDNLWCSYSGGISKIELNSPFVYYGEHNGIISNVLSCFADSKYYYVGTTNCIYVAPREQYSKRNIIFSRINYDKSFQENFCWNLQNVEDVILACTSEGLFQVFPNRAEKILDCGRCFNLATSQLYPNKILIASYYGLWIVDYTIKNGKIILSNAKVHSDIHENIYRVKVISDGSIWISTLLNGLIHFTPSGNDFQIKNIERIDTIGQLNTLRQLVLQQYGKYVYVNDGQIKKIVTDQETFTSTIEYDSLLNNSQINEPIEKFSFSNSTGDFFIKTQSSFYQINVKDSKQYKVLNFRKPIKSVYSINICDSLLLLGTDIGLIKRNINDQTISDPATKDFNVIINTITASDSIIFDGWKYFDKKLPVRDYSENQVVNIDYSNRNIKFNFSTSAFENISFIKYRYKLEGLNSEWSSWEKNNLKEFVNLSPGLYTFKVEALNCENVVTKTAIFKFKIKHPFYSSFWAILIYICLFILLIFIIIKYFTSALKKENTKLENIVQRRNQQLNIQREKLKQMSLVATKSTNAVAILDVDGNIEWINESFKDIYECEIDTFPQLYGCENFFDSKLASETLNQELIKCSRFSNQNISFESCHLKSNNTKTWLQSTLDALFDDQGKITNWILTQTDITLLKFSQEEGARQAQELSEAYIRLQESQVEMSVQQEQLLINNSKLEKGYKQIEIQNNTIKNSLRYAQKIQDSILPLKETINDDFDNFILYKPKDFVSGDFYWYEKISENTIILAVADCTGHGVPGAFMSLIGYNLLNEIILIKGITEPKSIFEQLSSRLISLLKQEKTQNYDGMEMRLCKLVKCDEGYFVTFCGSGSSIFYYDSFADIVIRVRGGRKQLGLSQTPCIDYVYEQHNFILKPDDKLFMITDGIIDQNNSQRKRFGSERFQKFLEDCRHYTMNEMGEILNQSLIDFMEGQPYRDDITVIGIKIKK
ncbi:MAG: SpoIIE family protein phosphatase [Bacteroidales bacterium]|nr:SpoIIE family protein phosphatase [Bacteroidales bacterium]